MADLRVYQALWAMEGLDCAATLGEKFDRVKAAGFQGMAIDLGALSFEQAEETVPHFSRTGLAAGLTAFPASDTELTRSIALGLRMGAPFLVVIGQEMPVKLADMIAVIERWLRIAAAEGLALQFETHRNCITNDLYTTTQLLEEIPSMRLAADLSHYVVDREMPCPPTPALSRLVSQVLQRSDSFQGRVAARGQIQLPLHFPQSQKWIALFKSWWRQGFACWRTRHASDASLVFLCELGPPDYALTNEQGRELSDRWTESLLLAEWARTLWQESASPVT